MKQPTLLSYQNYRYLKLASLLAIASMLAYIAHNPSVKPSGGTWLGYTLGTIGTLIILLLLAFGIRKRSYQSTLGKLQGWLSAHIYLGAALVIVATLHSGFEFGWNIHTLAYVLTLLVVASGFWGMYFYIRNPARMSAALRGETLEQHLLAIAEIDNHSRTLAMNHYDHVNQALLASNNAPLFENFWQQFSGKNPQCRTAAVTSLLIASTEKMTGEQAKINAAVYELQLQKLARLNRLRHYTRLKTWVDSWLIVHVPLSIALLAALTAHIVSVFFYW
ncbi:MAG: hypothetical protein PSX71_11185 [bacterium]|nr:hypothetical protein [bacterium]